MSNIFHKKPNEMYPKAVSFDEYCMVSGETLASANVKAYVDSTDEDVTSTVIASPTIADSNTDVQFTVKGGTAGITYRIVITVTTSESNIYEEMVLMVVEDA